MTNKEELQKHIQLLNEIKVRYPILTDTIKYLEKYQQSLTNLTLSECIKEWKKRGFIVNNNELYIFLHHEQYGISAFINKEEIKYHIYYGYISLELSELLTKTLKA